MADNEVPTNPDGTPTPAPTTPPAATPPAQPEKTFTQEDINRILAEEKRKHKAQYADYDQLKAAADELAKIKESQLSETEKLQKELERVKAAAQQAETIAKETRVKSALIAAAAKLNFNDPADAYQLVNRAAIEFDDAGEPKNADALVKELAESRKYLIKSTNPALATFNPAGGGNGVTETDAQKRARLYSGGGQQFFDPARAAQQGGGLVWPKGKPET